MGTEDFPRLLVGRLNLSVMARPLRTVSSAGSVCWRWGAWVFL